MEIFDFLLLLNQLIFEKIIFFLQEVQFGSQLRVQGRLRGRIIYLRVEFSWLGWVLMNSSEVILDIGKDFSFFIGNFFLKCVKYFFNKMIT